MSIGSTFVVSLPILTTQKQKWLKMFQQKTQCLQMPLGLMFNVMRLQCSNTFRDPCIIGQLGLLVCVFNLLIFSRCRSIVLAYSFSSNPYVYHVVQCSVAASAVDLRREDVTSKTKSLKKQTLLIPNAVVHSVPKGSFEVGLWLQGQPVFPSTPV